MKIQTGARTTATIAAAVLTLAACSSGGSSTGKSATSVDMAAELKKPASITFWSWVPGIQEEVKMFEQKYPNIKVNLVNAGQPADEYPKLRTALKAGTGAPDVVQLELHEVPSFTITKNLLDLSPYGASALKGTFVSWAWNQVAQGDAVYGIPQDTGPMGMLYRKDIFDKYGIAVPKTWDEFAAAAKKLHAANPNVYLTNMSPSDGSAFNGLLWQAGSRPFKTTGSTGLSVNLTDLAAQKVTGYWSPLIQQGLVSTDADFADQWFRGLNSGKYATWLTAAWGPVFLQTSAKDTAGKWRVAPLPQWSASENASGNWGGSADTVVRGTKYPAAAAALAEFINTDTQSTTMLASKQFLFPPTTPKLSDPAFLSLPQPFYGGQQVNQVFSDISKTVGADYTWSPFQDYVFGNFNDTVGKAMTGKQDLTAALRQWQGNIVGYAKQQGFAVSGG
jgi:multiple sugar transport system substrate-binding protein